MKVKTLKKKIRRLETRLEEGPRKLAKLKRKLELQTRANEAAAQQETAARHRTAAPAQKGRPAAKAPRPGALKLAASSKVRRTLNLTPERRAQLSQAMKARWAARRATLPAPNPVPTPPNRDFTLGAAPEGS